MYQPNARFLFHDSKFIFRNPEASVVRFINGSAEIYFSNNKQSLISLEASPFGGFMTDRIVVKEDVTSCLAQVEEWSKVHDMSHILIRLYPTAYHPESAALINEALLKFSFKILYADVAQIIDVTGGSLKLNADKKRRLRNCNEQGFEFRSLPRDFLSEGYSLIVQSRTTKGYPVTMSLEDLQNMFVLFPHEYLLFGMFDRNRMIAASVSIKVNDEILYCFYLGDDLEYRTYSPVTALVAGIFEFCQTHKFSTLDLGLSTDKGIMNHGLYAFKKSFGANDSAKLTFIKQV